MPPPIPRCSSWAYSSLISPSHFSLPRYGRRVGLHIVLFEACSAFTRVAACTLALSPIRDTLIEGFSHFVTSMTAPIASGWSGCRMGFAAVRLLHPMACPSTNSEVQDLFAKLLEKRFDTQEEAQKSAEILKARYPLLQVKVYDALRSGITCTKPAGSRPAGFALAYCCSLPWACIRRTAKASRSEIESFDRSRGRRNHLHKYIRICHRQRTALSATDKRRAICCGIELCTRGMSG